jgi:Mg/Co/Ni transporter MgtE
MAGALSAILSIAGFSRAIFFKTAFPEALAVTLALAMIVFCSVCIGAVLPIFLEWIGVDPAHSSTTIQGMYQYGEWMNPRL